MHTENNAKNTAHQLVNKSARGSYWEGFRDSFSAAPTPFSKHYSCISFYTLHIGFPTLLQMFVSISDMFDFYNFDETLRGVTKPQGQGIKVVQNKLLC